MPDPVTLSSAPAAEGGFTLVTDAGVRLDGYTFADPADAEQVASELTQRYGDALAAPVEDLRRDLGLRSAIAQVARERASFTDPVEAERPKGRWSGESYDADYDARRRAAKGPEAGG